MTFPGVPGEKPGEDWKVGNYGGTEQGVLDIVDATRVSSNTAYAQLMLEVGPQAVADLAGRLGVGAELPAVPSLVLGSGDVSPLDMAVGYSTFANRGVHNDPVMIAKIEQVDEDGDVVVLDQAVPTGDRVLTEDQADLVTYCLEGVVGGRHGHGGGHRQAGRRQDRHHPGQQGRLVRRLHPVAHRGGVDGLRRPAPRRHACPTMDAESSVASSRGLSGVTGGSLPAEIWQKFMRVATEGDDDTAFAEPTSFPGRILNERLDPTTTTEATSSTSSTTSSSTTATTVEDTTTTSSTTTSTHHDHRTDHHDDPARQLTTRRARGAPVLRWSRAGSWCGRGSTSARPRRAPRSSPPGPTPAG